VSRGGEGRRPHRKYTACSETSADDHDVAVYLLDRAGNATIQGAIRGTFYLQLSFATDDALPHCATDHIREAVAALE